MISILNILWGIHMKIAIIDDDQNDREYLITYIYKKLWTEPSFSFFYRYVFIRRTFFKKFYVQRVFYYFC